VEAELHSFIRSALYAYECSVSNSRRYILKEAALAPEPVWTRRERERGERDRERERELYSTSLLHQQEHVKM
jgi:hypothetical protein